MHVAVLLRGRRRTTEHRPGDLSAGEEHTVDDVHNTCNMVSRGKGRRGEGDGGPATVGGKVVCSGDLSEVDVGHLVVQSDAQMSTFKRQNLLALRQVGGEDLGAGDVVGEHADEIRLVLGLQQEVEELGGDLRESLVCGRKDGKGAGALRSASVPNNRSIMLGGNCRG